MLSQLRSLDISNLGEVRSLSPIKNLKKLEELHFYENTNIVDGDIRLLSRLRSLNDVRFMNRRHYNASCDEFPPWKNEI
jgi:hypothetical protein